MARNYDSKSIEIESADVLDLKELRQVVRELLVLLKKDIVVTTYFSHGDDAQKEITLADAGTVKPGREES